MSLKLCLKKHEVNIELVSKEQNLELIEKELKELKINYDKIIIENKELRKEIENLKNEIKDIKKVLNPEFNINRIKLGNKSVIMKENEFDLIQFAIKSRLNKEVKEQKNYIKLQLMVMVLLIFIQDVIIYLIH